MRRTFGTIDKNRGTTGWEKLVTRNVKYMIFPLKALYAKYKRVVYVLFKSLFNI